MKLFNAIADHKFAENICFLCGAVLDGGTRSVEHVFPKWILREFDIWDASITLLNGTTLPYRKLVVPCCKACNTGPLGALERKIERAYRSGFGGVSDVAGLDVLLWSLKILFGILYREVFLPIDRAKPSLGSIVSPESMENYRMLHYALQSLRVPMRFQCFDNTIPGSVYVFSLKDPPNRRLRFDFRDDIISTTISLRLGAVGILAAFDSGAQAVEGSSFFGRYQQHTLHPIQFAELGANFFMKAKMLARTPKFLVAEGDKAIDFTCLPLAGLSSRPVFDKWDRDAFGQMLSYFIGVPLEILRPSHDLTMSWLTDDNGVFADIGWVPPWSNVEHVEA